MNTLPIGWDYEIDVVADLLRQCRQREIDFALVIEEAEQRNSEDDRDAIGKREDGI